MAKKTEEYMKECVALRLRGTKIKDVCRIKEIHPPQLNKWMKLYADAEEFARLRKRYAVRKHKKRVAHDHLMDLSKSPIPRTSDHNINWVKLRPICGRKDFHIHTYVLYFSEVESA